MERKPEAAMEELRSVQNSPQPNRRDARVPARHPPVEVGEAGLVSSLRQSIAEFQKHSGIAAGFQSQGSPTRVGRPLAELVQIVQEALNNVRKHSKLPASPSPYAAARTRSRLRSKTMERAFPSAGLQREELDLLRLGPQVSDQVARWGKLTLESRPPARLLHLRADSRMSCGVAGRVWALAIFLLFVLTGCSGTHPSPCPPTGGRR